jgi:CRP/FNR family cyclic AMP-dependent transcriptional regulator
MLHPLLQHINTHISCSTEEFEQILLFFKTKHVKKHQMLLEQGQSVAHEYYVLKGCLKVFYVNENGKEYVTQISAENWWLSDYPAYMDKTPATLNITALEDTILLALSIAEKERMLLECPKMQAFFYKQLCFAYVSLQKRYVMMLHADPKKRYQTILELCPNIVKRVSKTLLASALGVSRETLSRLHKTK